MKVAACWLQSSFFDVSCLSMSEPVRRQPDHRSGMGIKSGERSTVETMLNGKLVLGGTTWMRRVLSQLPENGLSLFREVRAVDYRERTPLVRLNLML